MDDKQYEKLGRSIFSISYYWYAFKFVLAVSVISAVPLFLLHKPLYFAPIIGVVAFLVYRFLWRLFFKIMYKFSKMD